MKVTITECDNCRSVLSRQVPWLPYEDRDFCDAACAEKFHRRKIAERAAVVMTAGPVEKQLLADGWEKVG